MGGWCGQSFRSVLSDGRPPAVKPRPWRSPGACPQGGLFSSFLPSRRVSSHFFLVPPTIVDSRTSSDLVVRENSLVNLTCEATGSPKPELRWRRADGEMIRYKGGMGKKSHYCFKDLANIEGKYVWRKRKSNDFQLSYEPYLMLSRLSAATFEESQVRGKKKLFFKPDILMSP